MTIIKTSWSSIVAIWSIGSGGVAAFQSPSSSLQLQQRKLNSALNVASVAPPTSTNESTTIDAATDTESSTTPSASDEFNWFKAWHPVVPIEYLDIEKPHAFKLLGMDIVIWNDGPIDSPNPTFQSRKERANKKAKKVEGQWRAFVDACPHRKVPLSEGRIEDDGSLLCSYHAWRFNSEGNTIHIPQINSNEIEKIKANPKSNCNSFPVQIVDGVLWVWPDSSDDAKIESALKSVPINNFEGEDVPEERVWKGTWNFRELPYGHDYFIENVVDPAHGERYD